MQLIFQSEKISNIIMALLNFLLKKQKWFCANTLRRTLKNFYKGKIHKQEKWMMIFFLNT